MSCCMPCELRCCDFEMIRIVGVDCAYWLTGRGLSVAMHVVLQDRRQGSMYTCWFDKPTFRVASTADCDTSCKLLCPAVKHVIKCGCGGLMGCMPET